MRLVNGITHFNRKYVCWHENTEITIEIWKLNTKKIIDLLGTAAIYCTKCTKLGNNLIITKKEKLNKNKKKIICKKWKDVWNYIFSELLTNKQWRDVLFYYCY